MDDYCAPQWTDFTCSPQLPSDNYFDTHIEYEAHKPLIQLKSNLKSNLSVFYKNDSIAKSPNTERHFDDSLEPVQNAKDNISYFISHDNKKHFVKTKTKNSLSKVTKNLVKTNFNDSLEPVQNTKDNITYFIPYDNKKHSVKTKTENSLSKVMKNLTLDEKSYKIGCASNVLQRQSKMCKVKRSQPKVLTCQYRRHSVIKSRRRSSKFISLAEAVSKFQTNTPQRFRTISKKNLKPGPLINLKQFPMKLTHPISPALRSMRRARHTTILSKEERETLQLEEMKKHQIKANPVPLNILKAPSALKKVAKKPLTVAEESRLTRPKKTPHASDSEINTSQHSMDNNVKCAEKKSEKLKNIQIQDTNKIKVEFRARPAPKFLKSTKPTEEQSRTSEEQTVKKRTVVSHPFSFAERDKCLAQKKKEFVKQMQENDKKIQIFRANPVPNFKEVKVPNVKNAAKSVTTKQIKSCNNQENKQPNIRVSTIDTKKKPTKQDIVKNTKKKEHAS
ncbi:targeting protein for Xklp2 homolog [Colletes gigas]|uniref:targeting protein for Xklp2 homolog n=1 Tax=Colletes gigas TaxID=935657 RepID=UPI001C9AB0E1|nr:targeting protein for Xklp2 homolog [Colletes gigas]